MDEHATASCEVCRSRAEADRYTQQQSDMRATAQGDAYKSGKEAQRRREVEKAELPMQTVISRALRDLEDDFGAHKK